MNIYADKIFFKKGMGQEKIQKLLQKRGKRPSKINLFGFKLFALPTASLFVGEKYESQIRGGMGMGMGMANQLELISVYACCSTRATKGSMEGAFS